ncbi:unnamed protein product [Ceutorhynchus assimilis]|uniref:Uncharacterized protein n=1 Tax=Ceutorhynchus assimilis TaxID=467358 RepID=A0A9N9MNM2_9CUCU|nr:unnamed protein product [Ceutorhynchus assimilis]
MASYGNIEQFNVNEPKGWESYVERMTFYFSANDIADEAKKLAIFLSLCGPHTCEILRSSLAPDKNYTGGKWLIIELAKENWEKSSSNAEEEELKNR